MINFNVKNRIREFVERLGRHLSEDCYGAGPGIDDKTELMHILCVGISEYYDNESDFSGKTLVIWLNADVATFMEYNTDRYKQQIQSYLYCEKELVFYSVEFRRGVPGMESTSVPLGMSAKYSFQIVNANPSLDPVSKTIKKTSTEKERNAVIRIAGEYGSLEKKEYRISADEMERDGIDAYNIGVCSHPQNADCRRNHIAICGDKNDPMYERNKFVSRTHAHIGFDKTTGFYLKVDYGGTTKNGKSTHIIRDGKKRLLDNIQSEKTLKDGDKIVLSESVTLLFSVIQE